MHGLRLLLALVAIVGVAACGGGGNEPGGVETSVWADDVCSSVASWVADLEGSSQELVGSIAGSTDIAGVRDQIVEFLRTAVLRTDALVDDVDAIGAPAIDQGEAIAADVRSALVGLRDLLSQAQGEAQALPTDDPVAFASAAQELAASIQTAAEDASGTFDELGTRYDLPELEDAFQASDACAELRG